MKQPSFRTFLALSLTLGSALALPSLAQTPTPSGDAHYFEGKAYATANGKLAYTEAHWTYGENGKRSELVLYQCPDGKAFARKLAHDHGDAQAPDFKLEDARNGYEEGVRDAQGKRQIFVRDKRGAKERTATLKTDPTPVIDGGFDDFVRHHWSQMQPHDEASIHFLVPSRLETMKFKLERNADKTIDGHEARIYRLSLDSFLSFALPHIDVAYDAHSQTLLRFDGLTNIRGSDGKNLTARVMFDPGQDRDVSQGDVKQASQRPLDGRCSFP